MGKIKGAVDHYSAIHHYRDNCTPSSLDELLQFASTDKHVMESTPLRKEDLLAPWDEPIEYETDGHRYRIRSSGPDKTMGTADDVIRGWPPEYVEEERQKARQVPAVVSQKTNAVKKATAEPIRPPVATDKKTPDRVAPKDGQPQDEPDKTNATPRKLPLLVGVTTLSDAVVAVNLWCSKRLYSE